MSNTTKEIIIINFLKSAADYGLGSVSLNHVAEMSGIQKASIYSHFSSKSDLQSSAMTYCKKILSSYSFNVKFKDTSLHDAVFSAAAYFVKIFDTEPLKWYYRIVEENRFINSTFSQAELEILNMFKSHFSVIMEYYVQTGVLSIPDTDNASTLLSLSFHQQISQFNVREKMEENPDEFDWEMEKLLSSFLDLIQQKKF